MWWWHVLTTTIRRAAAASPAALPLGRLLALRLGRRARSLVARHEVVRTGVQPAGPGALPAIRLVLETTTPAATLVGTTAATTAGCTASGRNGDARP